MTSSTTSTVDNGADQTPILFIRRSPHRQPKPAAPDELFDASVEDAELLRRLADERFDRLEADGVLETLARPDIALSNWIRVMRPEGQIVIRARKGGTSATPGLVVQEPKAPEGSRNVLELVQVVCHLAELERVDAGAADRIEVVLRKRARPMTPVQSNHLPEVEAAKRLARAAVDARAVARPMTEFETILKNGVLEATVVDLGRLYLLYQWLLVSLRVPGDCIEVGSFRGGTGKLISETLLARGDRAELHMFDTFKGMPDRLSLDEVGLKGCFAETSLEAVQQLVANNPAVHLHAGIFPESLPAALHERRFRFAHIDVDIEQSVQDCLAFIYPRMNRGGIIVIDDYGHTHCPGATRAAEQFFVDKPETIVQMPLISSAAITKL